MLILVTPSTISATLLAEFSVDFFQSHLGIFHRIVQQTSGNRMGIKSDFRKNFSHGKRV